MYSLCFKPYTNYTLNYTLRRFKPYTNYYVCNEKPLTMA